MFPATKPVVAQSKKRAKQPKRPQQPKKKESASPEKTDRSVIVEPEWMARYWENAGIWGYYIPEDNEIKFRDGKYILPIVVFKHGEAMFATPRRTPAAVSD